MMVKAKQAPKGKGKREPKKASPKNPKKTDTKAPEALTIARALQFLQSNGIQIEKARVSEITEVARIRTGYVGPPSDSPDTKKLKVFFLQALEKTLGIVSTAADLTGIHRSTHYEWMSNDLEYSDCVKAIGDLALDFGESNLHQLIKEKNPAAVIFFMKTKGKKRGYIETVHNMNQNFEDNNVHYFLPENGRDVPEAEVMESKKLTP